MGEHNFKVLIAGGSIAGLVLANMLEQVGIDFLVLEAYPEIAPQVGASIGFFPNGCRILDQIGCYDGVRGKLDQELMDLFYNSRQGIPLSCIPHAGQHFVERHGYGIIFIDRQMAIEVFYNNLKDKSKVLVDKRVVTVTPLANGVQVTTKDGATYTGDILVGADGVHSTIRKEMWRLGDELAPGRFPQADRTDVPCDYHCMFGISKNVVGLNKSSTQTVLGHNNSYLVIDGPGSRTYWFLFSKNERRLRGMEKEIPRSFTDEEKRALAEKHWNDPITSKVTFGDLYANHTSAVLTAIPEYVNTEWFLGRTIITGDAVHKFNPISGQGGNNALETAATLTTQLLNMLRALPPGQRPSDADITAAFQRTQDTRRAPVTEAVDISHQQQSIFACETPLFGVLARIIPFLGAEGTFEKFADAAVPARRLPMLLMPKRPRFEPYIDELPAKPLRGLAFSMLLSTVIFAGLFYTALNRTEKTVLTLLGNGASLPDLLQAGYLFPLLVIWTVEAYRNANVVSFVSLPVVFGIAAQFRLGQRTYHVYPRNRTPPSQSPSPTPFSPAVILGYAVPLVFARAGVIDALPPVISRVALPVLVAFNTYIAKRIWEAGSPPDAFDMYKKADVGPLRVAYAVAFLLSAGAHGVLFGKFSPLVDTSALLSSGFAAFASSIPRLLFEGTSMDVSAWFSLENDFVLFTLASALFSLHSVYELRRTGWATTTQALVAALAVIAFQPLVGPAAVYAAVWFWREGVWSQEVDLQGRKD
ncbi:Monooxygenase FAD-binding protein [Mycena sanguinolenta]|uniref:Monooxygenase FAD-binding protein n=1 Tax=Mycena sanguinolenta TaxID=230812 RepID=A0A8H6Y0K7_9AGAR|nr:Monooxygenase FAD-binding protein [Mycena sanguinolenta]